MRNASPLLVKSYNFALKIIRFCGNMQKQREYNLSKQLLRSGTSVGSNIKEAQQAQSRKDFISKLSIALKEAYETRFWLRLIRDSKIVIESESSTLIVEVEELIRMLVAAIKTLKIV